MAQQASKVMYHHLGNTGSIPADSFETWMPFQYDTPNMHSLV